MNSVTEADVKGIVSACRRVSEWWKAGMDLGCGCEALTIDGGAVSGGAE